MKRDLNERTNSFSRLSILSTPPFYWFYLLRSAFDTYIQLKFVKLLTLSREIDAVKPLTNNATYSGLTLGKGKQTFAGIF